MLFYAILSEDAFCGLQGFRPTGRRPKIKTWNSEFLHKRKVEVTPSLSLLALMQLLAGMDSLDPAALGKCRFYRFRGVKGLQGADVRGSRGLWGRG